MAIQIQMNNRTKILAGVVVLAAAGAAAWFFLFNEDAPPPEPPAPPVAQKAGDGKGGPGAPAESPKGAEASKAGEAPKAAEAPKGATPEAGKAAAAASGAGAKPIPTDPDKLIAEVLDTSGMNEFFEKMGSEFASYAAGGGRPDGLPADAMRSVQDAAQRIFEPQALTKEVAASLRTNLDVERMSRFLELLRQPLAVKMTAEEVKRTDPQEARAYAETMRKTPPPAARTKLIQALDQASGTSTLTADLLSTMTREMVDAMLADLQKQGKKASAEARRAVGAKLNAMRAQIRAQVLHSMYFTYRNVSDDDLAGYVKLMETESGRWGSERLAEAMRPAMSTRYAALGKEIARVALANRSTLEKAAPPEPEPLAKAEPAPAPAAPAAAPAAPSYQRPANIRDLYSKYNDLVSATVMRDKAAVKELLDDGKYPNARQKDGTTPLMIAASNGDLEIAQLLIAKGADPNARADQGVSALSIARSRGAAGAPMVQLLQSAGARE